MKKIPIYNSKRFALVSNQDYKLVRPFRWILDLSATGRVFYTKALCGGKYIRMHKLILPGCAQVDHKDRNGLNNTRSNLRPCNSSQNQANRIKIGSHSSKYKGVHWSSRHKRWTAKIKVNQRDIYIGQSKNEKEAAHLYNEAAKIAFGEFARINDI